MILLKMIFKRVNCVVVDMVGVVAVDVHGSLRDIMRHNHVHVPILVHQGVV